MGSPTQKSLEHLRDQGYKAAVTERWNQFVGIRQDLFGFIDILAYHPEKKEFLAIQTTSGSNAAARVTKILGIEYAQSWLKTGGKIHVHSWAKYVAYKKDGTKAKLPKWDVRVIDIKLDDASQIEGEISEVKVSTKTKNRRKHERDQEERHVGGSVG